jgi:prevent-host-death family protein
MMPGPSRLTEPKWLASAYVGKTQTNSRRCRKRGAQRSFRPDGFQQAPRSGGLPLCKSRAPVQGLRGCSAHPYLEHVLPEFDYFKWSDMVRTMKAVKSIPISEFKAKCLGLIDEVSSGAEIVISKRGKPVARVIRIDDTAGASSFGSWRGKISTVGDLVHPGWEKVFDFE